jgi:membrane-bound lytic murein transglycosylase MltF
MSQLETLTLEDLSVIKESLKYTKLKFEDYQGYPSHEFKQKRVNEVAEVLYKISEIIKFKKTDISQ